MLSDIQVLAPVVVVVVVVVPVVVVVAGVVVVVVNHRIPSGAQNVEMEEMWGVPRLGIQPFSLATSIRGVWSNSSMNC